MSKTYISDKTFDKVDFTENPLTKGDYENCTFSNCNFASADISGINFSECEFKSCNLSLASLTRTAIRDIRFSDCKLVGLHFENCNELLFSATFEKCILNLSSFYKLSLKKASFKHCSMHEVDFTETELSGSLFDNCDLLNATFSFSGLEKCDFLTSFNYSIDPETNRIKKAKFSLNGISGLLDKYDIEISS